MYSCSDIISLVTDLHVIKTLLDFFFSDIFMRSFFTMLVAYCSENLEIGINTKLLLLSLDDFD